jgi:hypothetical protein
MKNATSSPEEKFGQGVTLRVDLTGVLACLLMVLLVISAAVSYGSRHRIDGVVQPVGPKAAIRQVTVDATRSI